MALVDGRLYFAPGLLMADLDLSDPRALVDAFERRVRGLFLEPIRILQHRSDGDEGALFAAALLVAALIESIARIETGSRETSDLIRGWLETNVDGFQRTVTLRGGRGANPETRTLADVFEHRFRNGLAHSGYVASLGRLSRSVQDVVSVTNDIVIVNPFSLADYVERNFAAFADDLRNGRRDIRAFSYRMAEQFRPEVDRARIEAAAN